MNSLNIHNIKIVKDTTEHLEKHNSWIRTLSIESEAGERFYIKLFSDNKQSLRSDHL